MPELPEVEIVVRGLRQKIIGRKITAVSFDWPRKIFINNKNLEDPRTRASTVRGSSSDKKDKLQTKVNSRLKRAFVKNLAGEKVIGINRHGKIIQIALSSSNHLLIHLKLTGQLIFINKKEHWAAGHPNDDFLKKMPSKATRLTVKFADGSQLYFNDQRKFGWAKLLNDREMKNEDTIQKLGPDALSRQFNVKYLKSKLGARKIKQIILDQNIVSGIGNIYADESLFVSRLDPNRRGNSLKDNGIKKLVASLKKIMRLSIKLGGTSLQNYVNSDGRRGVMKERLKMYGRKNEKCLVCKNVIKRTVVGGRGTYFCKKCQR